jgi:hypothetical protein
MPYLSILRIKGDADELLAAKQEIMDPVMERVAPEFGSIAHAAAKTEDGILVVNVWETREGSEEVRNNPEAGAAIDQMRERTGSEPEFEHHELVDWRTPGVVAGA